MIKGIQKTSLIDYPGKICATLFLSKCNFRCGYCYNRELVLGYREMPTIEFNEVLEFLKKRKNVLDGVCITGGEPTLHKTLPELIRKIKELGYLVKLDTNGTNPEMLKELVENKLIDYISIDIKAPLEKYYEVTGVKTDIDKIKGTIKLIKHSSIDYEFRTTVLPRFISEEDIENIGKLLDGSKRFFLQQFKPTKSLIDSGLEKEKQYSAKELERFKNILKKYIKEVEVRGV